jgi:hypothetical protein
MMEMAKLLSEASKEIGKKFSPTELLKNSESSGISGDKFEIDGITDEITEKKEIQEKSPYSDTINDKIRTEDELGVYTESGLEEAVINDNPVLIDNSIDIGLIDDMGRTNLERMEKGLAPLDANGEPYNLHHIGQKMDSPLAELKNGTHKSEYSTLHDTSIKESDIDRQAFNKQRAEHWKARAEAIKNQQGESNV